MRKFLWPFVAFLLSAVVFTTAFALTPDQRVVLLVAPQPTLNLDFRACSGIDSRITFTRAANTATFFGSNLLLKTANANIPRLDYNYATGACNGLFIEQASTNLAIQNRDLTQTAWVKVTATAALDQTGIDGAANSASSLLATAGNATALQTVVHASSTDTYSVYVKRLTGTGEVDISTDGTTWTALTSSNCTLGNGPGATASALLTTAWVRCIVTQATVVNPAIGIRIVTNGDKVALDYSQLEVLGFATSPILTGAASVTRNADAAAMAGSSFGVNQNAGTLFVAALPGPIIQNSGFAQLDNGIDSNRYFFYRSTSGNTYFFNNIKTTQISLGASGLLSLQKMAAVYGNGGGLYGTLNGGAGSSDSGTTLSTGITNLLLGGVNESGTTFLNGWLQQVKYWPQRLPNQTLIQMTRPGQTSMLIPEPANDNHAYQFASNGR